MLQPVLRATAAAALVAWMAVTPVLADPRAPAPSMLPAVADASPVPPPTPAGPGGSADPASPGVQAAQDGGDLRSSGEGAGLAGAPLVAIGAVVVIGAVSAALTFAYVRLTADRAGRSR